MSYYRYDNHVSNIVGQALEGVSIAVLTQPATLTSQPGTPLATIYSNSTGTPLSNPFQTDALGNFNFYAAAGIYTVQIYDVLNRIPELDLLDQNVVAGAANGSVTSVAMTMDGTIFAASVSGSPISSAGTFAPSLNTVAAHYALLGPTSGSAAAPTYRALVASDMPSGLGYVTSVGLTVTVPTYETAAVTSSPVTSSGTIAVAITANSQTANLFLASAVSGGSSTPAYRNIAVPDLPTLNGTVTITTGTSKLVTFGTAFNYAPTVILTPLQSMVSPGTWWVASTAAGFTVHTDNALGTGSPPATASFYYLVVPNPS
jgi:hypothetical protein